MAIKLKKVYTLLLLKMLQNITLFYLFHYLEHSLHDFLDLRQNSCIQCHSKFRPQVSAMYENLS